MSPSQKTRQTVRVDLGTRGYDIIIGTGLLTEAAAYLSPYLSRSRVFIVTDETIAGLHLKALETGLETAGLTVNTRTLKAGEGTKSFAELEALLDWLLGAGAGRDDVLIALGGGVIGDLTGLAAALMKRGMKFVQIPTTLLAQVDSSVGGKTAVNTGHGKNLIGAFYQPVLVIADTDTLATLPMRELQAGYAEIVKYGLIDDKPFFDWLAACGHDVLQLEPAAISEAVACACRAKARIVAEDEREGGVRALLNLGHTFGHALEAANEYQPNLLHGEAVAAGTVLALRYSARLGLMSLAEGEQVVTVLKAAGLVTELTELSGGPYRPSELVAFMRQDKKARADRVPLILARGIGRSFIHPDSDLADVKAFLDEEARLV